jgi:branched-chain amino acid transport system ATP-binding protein
MVLTRPDGESSRLNGLKPNQVTERGMARTFQNIRLFQNMTVLENVMIGRHCRLRSGIPGAILRSPTNRREEKQVVDDSYRMLEKINLTRYVNEFAKNLPYGAQRRLEIARALATEPFLLLLDEPAAGMNALETKALDDLILRLRSEMKVSILLIEHDMKLVMSLSDRIYVMDYGKKIAEGNPTEIKRNPAVIKAYLGEDIDA